jgi:hypothetical protein
MGCSFLLLCTIHKHIETAKLLRKLHGIREAVPVYGTYDCVVKTEEMSSDDVMEFVSSSIRPLANVNSVLTLYPVSQVAQNPHVQ